MLQHSIGILTKPTAEWQRLSEIPENGRTILLLYSVLWAILPAVAWHYGTTHVGWSVGGGDTIRLTEDSATVISFLFYIGMISCVVAIGYFIHWMADTYGAQSTLTKGILIAAISATPMFVAGAVGFYPLLWLDMLVGVAAVSWSVYLLYIGIPIVMGISTERGFLFASAVMGVALVILICLMVGSVMLWEWGAGPTFAD